MEEPADKEPGDAGHAPVDVVIPVFGAGEDLARCLRSLRRHTDLERHRLVLVVDGPADDRVEAALACLDDLPAAGLAVLRNPVRRGFVHSVNRGMALSDRDVVLLNSDTEATSGWLEKLQAAARSAPDVATATPLSNNATICSVPRTVEENLLPTGYDAEAFGELVERVSRRERPALPVGVGVCLYINRPVLDRLGLFDEETFGLGYGEETEYCMRAAEAGYRHVAADDSFVYHAGQRSFGRSRGRRVRVAHRRMKRLHPTYLRLVAEFLADDTLAPTRRRLAAALIRRPRHQRESLSRPKVLHVVHGWPPFDLAGTELYARWLALRQARERETVAFARIANSQRDSGKAIELLDRGIRVRLLVNNFEQRNPLARNALLNRRMEQDLARLLDEERPDLVHVHHLAGHALSLLRPIRRRGLPWLLQVQDWWTCCARTNLLDRDGRPCSGPGLGKCSRCLPLTGRPPSRLWNRLLYAFRNRLARRALAQADLLVAGSRFLVESLDQLGWLHGHRTVRVVPYGVDLADRMPRRRVEVPPSLPLRLGFIGSLLPHKGLHVAAEACRDLAMVELHAWGDPTAAPHYVERVRKLAGQARLELHGRFAEDQKAAIFEQLDLLLMPSMGLESFGLVAREAFHCGVPVIASRCGAPEELLAGQTFGALVDRGRPDQLRGWIRRLVEDPAVISTWRRDLPAVTGMDAHAEEMEAVYREVLERRAGA